ncbi:death-associated protein 1 isoform X1 [Tachyglossus aculeatus]|uniref:death-associated protein 1 isoform X1 n=1 Tax=Tachyglossus aculeatus TaxID=9261 RepID=UPI0018F53638|nr:death-associated protein 1 isoform X1 [Tachyglossus aculeatus]
MCGGEVRVWARMRTFSSVSRIPSPGPIAAPSCIAKEQRAAVDRMSSPPQEKIETKAGHPPAVERLTGSNIFILLLQVKAGGMRIVQKHPHTGEPKEEKDKDDQEWESTSPPKPTVFISGVLARGDKDFPPAAAQVAHQKPHASMEKHPSHKQQHIQQPRK